MSLDSELVSVVIPAYNAAPFVAEAINSVLGQSHRKLEVIVVDDGSTDATSEVAHSAGAGDSRVRCISQGNMGVAAARNKGIEASTGEWVAFLDADDLWLEPKLEGQLDYIVDRRLGRDCLVGTLAAYFGRRRGPVGTVGLPTSQIDVDSVSRGRLMPFLLSSTLVGRRVLERAGGFLGEMAEVGPAEDLEFVARLAREGVRIGCLGERLTYYRLHSGAASERQHARLKRAARFVRAHADTFEAGGHSPTPAEFAQQYEPTVEQLRADRVELCLRRAAVEFVDGSLVAAARYMGGSVVKDPLYVWRRAKGKLAPPPGSSRRAIGRRSPESD